ncbi:VWA domain-containing protein [Aliihoeflea sp. PC F10.4]
MSDKTPIKTTTNTPAERSDPDAVSAFLKQARALAETRAPGARKGRLILALDATMSRQPTWDLACTLQADMFDAVGKTGRLEVQLVYFRGFGECRSSQFVDDTARLKDLMVKIDCRGGHTQISKVLAHALKETDSRKVDALVYIGDAMEEEIDDLADKAGRLGLKGVPVFIFQEGHDASAETAFREVARLTRGAWFRFDRNAASTLAGLLSAIAVYASGGYAALDARGKKEDRLLIQNMRGQS